MLHKKYFIYSVSIMICWVVIAHLTERTSDAAENVLENGGFEEAGTDGLPKGWLIVPGHSKRGEAIMDHEDAHSGAYSLRLAPGKKNTDEGFMVFTRLDPEVIQGKEITISGYAKLQGRGENIAAILLKTDKMNWLVIPQTDDKTFFPFSKTFMIADAIPEAVVLLVIGGKKGKIWFDDLSMSATADSTHGENREESPPLTPDDNEYTNKINTPGWQDSAFISPDGRELYFAYMPYAQNDFMDIVLGKISEEDVKIKGPIRPGSRNTMLFETYKVVRKADGTWERPVYLNITDNYSVYAAKRSFDGNELYYVIRDFPGGYGSGDIYVSKKRANGEWGAPEQLGTQVNTAYNEDTPFLSSDGQSLYFARNIGDALGFEIMVSHKRNGTWGNAEKVAYPINEPNPEKTANHQPFITADGKEFYFTRIQQLYTSDRQPDGTWGKPKRVFPSLPVSGHASVTADGRYLYFLSVKDKESLKRQQWTIWYAERQADGSWGNPIPVD